jgi:RHH-type rel operon transcriptional repressor/antitoxin RelB
MGGINMAISLRMNNDDTQLIKSYAKLHGLSVSEFMRQSALEHIENEYDLSVYNDAIKTFKANPETYTLDEVEKKLGLK